MAYARSMRSKISKSLELIRGLSSGSLAGIQSGQKLLAYKFSSINPDELTTYLEYAPRLPNSALTEAKLFPSREIMLTALPKGGVVAEVGTWQGYFSQLIGETCRPDDFHLIDMDFAPLRETAVRAAIGSGGLHKHQGDSAAIIAGFPPSYFDWLYVDGDHGYDGVRRDLAAAHVALKPGGHLMCNDYTNWSVTEAMPYGVSRAVNELILAHGYTVTGFAFHPANMPDILIRKPTIW